VSGAKSFVVRYRLNGKPQKLTLGRWLPPEDRKKATTDPQVGDPISLASARKLAADTMLHVSRGRDPVAARREDKQAKRQAVADTFEAIGIEYLKRECGMKLNAEGNPTFDRSKKRSGHEQHRMLKRQVFPTLGGKPITEIKRSDIIRLLDRLADGELRNDEGDLITGGVVAADRCLAIIRKVMNWHAVRSDDFHTPIVRGMARTKPKEHARDRVLSDDEIRMVWKTAEEGAGVFDRYLQFVLLTAVRRSEASDLDRSEIDGTTWTIPAVRYKTKIDFVVPLSAAALDVLKKLPEIQGCKFVFSTNGKNPISGWTKFNAEFHQRCGVKDWTIHDLRRTARSLMSRAGVAADHAERCLGHVIGGVRGVYDRHEFFDEKKQAFEALAALIDRIVNPLAGNVVAFQKAGE
jgi:integrase